MYRVLARNVFHLCHARTNCLGLTGQSASLFCFVFFHGRSPPRLSRTTILVLSSGTKESNEAFSTLIFFFFCLRQPVRMRARQPSHPEEGSPWTSSCLSKSHSSLNVTPARWFALFSPLRRAARRGSCSTFYSWRFSSSSLSAAAASQQCASSKASRFTRRSPPPRPRPLHSSVRPSATATRDRVFS